MNHSSILYGCWIFLWPLVLLSLAKPVTLEKRKVVYYISSGKTSIPNSHPWLLNLGIPSPGDKPRGCGASLIRVKHLPHSSNIAVTAAHCILILSETNSTSCHGMKDLFQGFVVTAANHYMSQYDQGEVDVKVVDGDCHQDWTRKGYTHDIAVLKLEKPIDFTDKIQPIDLVKKDQPPVPGQRCTVAGWGLMEYEPYRVPATVLQELDVIVQDDNTCAKHDQNYNPQTMLCAVSAKGKGQACMGDSGGVLMCKRNGKPLQEGVVSYSTGPAGKCDEAAVAAVYTKMSVHEEWVEEMITKLL